MIFTDCGKLGDFLFTLPIANWYWKTYGEKIHYVLSDGFNLFKTIVPPFLRTLPYVGDVTVVPHKLTDFGHGGQPYRFNPADYGVPGPYYNLGFRAFPNKYCAEWFAEEHKFQTDYENLVPYTPDMDFKDKIVYTNKYNRVKEILPVEQNDKFFELPLTDSLETNIRRMMAAKEVWSFMDGSTVMCDLFCPQKRQKIVMAKSSIRYCHIFFHRHSQYIAQQAYVGI